MKNLFKDIWWILKKLLTNDYEYIFDEHNRYVGFKVDGEIY